MFYMYSVCVIIYANKDYYYYCGSSTPLPHRNCVSTYTSNTHIKRFLLRQNRMPDKPVVKRTCRSDISPFNFKEHCLICGEKCCPKPDPKHPNRWGRVIQCRTVYRGPDQSTFKDVIIDACDLRNDDWGQQVRLRIEGTVSDLHAADTQYHKDCMSSFRGPRNVKSSAAQENEMSQDEAFMCVVDDLREDLSRIWNSIEVHNLYKFYKGKSLTRRQLIKKLAEHFRQDLLILSGTGVASILVFQSKASNALKRVANEDDDAAIGKIAKLIVNESKDLKNDKYKYRVNIDDPIADVSSAMLHLLSLASPKLDSSLSACMVGNIVTSMVTNRPTALQIALGVLVRQKSLTEQLYDFGVTSSYDEILRFKASVAHAAAKIQNL